MCKTAAWGQGPAGLQQLRLLEGFDVSALGEAELVHVLTEAAKLAFADRDANYGDVDVQLHHLLSKEYADARRALIGDDASAELRPGDRTAAAARGRRLGRSVRASRPAETPFTWTWPIVSAT